MYNSDPFNYLRPVNRARFPPVYTKIQVHLIYDYKQDGRYKVRMMDSGNMTGTDIDTYYSSVISLRSMCTVVFLSKLNNMETCTGDISNAYLTACITEKIVFNDGPEFAPFGHECQFILINNELYGLKNSGTRFSFHFSYDLTALIHGRIQHMDAK